MKESKGTTNWLRLTIVSLFAAAFLTGCSDTKHLEETKQIGNTVVQALEKYRADNGRYPVSLEKLVPAYLFEIPKPTWGLKKWKYETENKDEFDLRVDESIHTGDGNALWFRYFKDEGWQTGD
jgi:hypothetical protein